LVLTLGDAKAYARGVTPYELEVREPELHGFTVIALAGELDLTNVLEIEAKLDEATGDGGVVLELNRVTFVDSAALHMLFRVARRIGDARRFGIVLEPTGHIARTLEIVGLDTVTTVRSTVDELVLEPTP
jgi:anti-anti-sigma factor